MHKTVGGLYKNTEVWTGHITNSYSLKPKRNILASIYFCWGSKILSFTGRGTISNEASTQRAEARGPKAVMESRTQMARPRTYSINPKVCAMATFPCGGASYQRARAGTPGLWQKRITSVVTYRQDGNELTLIKVIMVFARIIRTFFAAVSVRLCVTENFTRPRTRKCVLKDPRGQGHVLEVSITAQRAESRGGFLRRGSKPSSTS